MIVFRVRRIIMPELPDLYVYAENLKKQLLNKKITEVKTFAAKKINVSPQVFVEGIAGAYFTDIAQDGKEIKFSLSNGNSFYVHLMLSGLFTISSKYIDPNLFNKITAIFFDDDTILSISDRQMMAKIEFNPKARLVPDALSEEFTYPYFLSLVLGSSRRNIKALLLDQKCIRGIGNAYCDEILYNAGVSPKSITGKIPEWKIEDIYEQIKDTLLWGIENIQYISPNIISGEIRDFFKVHNKKLRKTKKGEMIIVEQIATKKTYYTRQQEVYE